MFKIFLCVIGIIIAISIIIFFILRLYKEYKEFKTIDEKIVFFLILCIFLVPLVIFLLDIYDLPSKFSMFKNSSSDKWFNFLTTYISSIFGATIGALVLLLVTIHQMIRQDEKDKDALRITNMPLLSYKISRNRGEVNLENYFITNCQNGKIIDFDLEIKNIGMNTIKKSFIIFSSNDFDNSYSEWLDNKGLMDKNDSVIIYKYLNLSNGQHTINATIYYCDLINNWYSQNIIINFDITNCFDANGSVYIPIITVKDEKFIKDEPKELIELL